MSNSSAYTRPLLRLTISFLLVFSALLLIASYNSQHRSFFFLPSAAREEAADSMSRDDDDPQRKDGGTDAAEAPNVTATSRLARDFAPLEDSHEKSQVKKDGVDKFYDNMIKSKNKNTGFHETVGKPVSTYSQDGRTRSEIEYIKSEKSLADVESSQEILEHQIDHQASDSSNFINITSGKVLYRYKDIIDKKRRTKKTRQGDIVCKSFKVHFARVGALTPCALASYPGSGNTYTRKLIEYASGLFTGSIYNDMQLFIKGYYGELENWSSGTTIAQKTHKCRPSHVDAFNQTAILLLRNPYRAILSFHNYLFAGHTGFAPVSNYRRKDWSAFVHIEAKSWLELAINWTTKARPEALTVIHYENLTEDPLPDLDRVLRNRGFDPDHQRLDCLEQAFAFKTFQRKTEFIPEKLIIFSPRERDKIDRAIRYVDYLLRQKGQQPLPLHLYEFYNRTEDTHVTRIPCQENETEVQCDERVDSLNKMRDKNKTVVEMISEIVSRPNIILNQRSISTKEDVSRFDNSSGTQPISTLLGSLLNNINMDPIDALFHYPTKTDMMRRDLHLETDGNPEAALLMHDFKGVHSSPVT